jgi:hypothetical protein
MKTWFLILALERCRIPTTKHLRRPQIARGHSEKTLVIKPLQRVKTLLFKIVKKESELKLTGHVAKQLG